jgi:hypothetical protein
MFLTNFQEAQVKHIEFRDASFQALRIVVEFLYGGQLPTLLARAPGLFSQVYKFAYVRGMDVLTASLRNLISTHRNQATFQDRFEALARKLGDDELLGLLYRIPFNE